MQEIHTDVKGRISLDFTSGLGPSVYRRDSNNLRYLNGGLKTVWWLFNNSNIKTIMKHSVQQEEDGFKKKNKQNQ